VMVELEFFFLDRESSLGFILVLEDSDSLECNEDSRN
jgi:hypothetical protein